MEFSNSVQLIRTLKDIGLSAKEATIYIILLMYGSSPASTVAQKAEIHRGTCYDILNNLMKKGFIQQTNKRKVAYFTAVNPKYLLTRLKDQRYAIDDKIENLRCMVSEFEKIRCDVADKPKVIFFEGDAGIQNIMEDSLSSNETIRVYTSLKELEEILPRYLPEYQQRLCKRNIRVRAIYPASTETYHHKLRDTLENRQSRLIPPEFDFHLNLMIYENKVAITSIRERFGVLITSKDMADTQKRIFDFIWEATQKYDAMMTHMVKKKLAARVPSKTHKTASNTYQSTSTRLKTTGRP